MCACVVVCCALRVLPLWVVYVFVRGVLFCCCFFKFFVCCTFDVGLLSVFCVWLFLCVVVV